VGKRDLRDLYRRAKAFVFSAEEDFGITPVEAQACGCPVLAFGKGGARETVREGVSGGFYAEQTVESLLDALRCFQPESFDPAAIRDNSERFSSARFRREFTETLGRIMNEE
jgi:glycosyltransferase involved in cell wall biosynthesis